MSHPELSGRTADTAMIEHPARMERHENTIYDQSPLAVHNLPVVSINSLPVELLVKIFVWLKIMFPCNPSGCFAWSPILLVNQEWNKIAINCSFLWSELDISFNIPRSYFTRSCIRPLTLWWCQRDSAPGVTLDQYSAHFLRTRSLSLLGLPQDNGVQAFHGLTSLPLLEELGIYTTSDEPLAEVFISGYYPKLTRLTVILEGPFQWKYTIFSPNLRYLEINRCGVLESGGLTTLIDGLRNMPLLETLRLIHPYVYVSTVVSALELPKLQYLLLAGDIEICTALLECFTLPLNTNIDVRIALWLDNNYDVQVPEDALLDLSEALRDKIALRDDSGSLVSPPINYMLVQQYEYRQAGFGYVCGAARLRLLRSNELPTEEPSHSTLLVSEAVRGEKYTVHQSGLQGCLEGIHVMFIWDIAEHKTFQPLAIWPAAICQSLPLEQVTTVSMDLRSSTTSMGIGRMCPNVTTVIAKDEQDGINGLRYLLDADDNGKRRADRPHFPKLKTLVIDRLDIPRPISLRQELDRLRLSLRGLRISRTLTLERFYLARQDPIASLFTENYVPKLKELKAAFPEIDISMLDEEFLPWAECEQSMTAKELQLN